MDATNIQALRKICAALLLGSFCTLGLLACRSDDSACGGAACEAPCTEGTHRCGAECVADSRIEACGEACMVCVGRPHAQPTCDVGSCGLVCESGYADCNGDLLQADGDGCEVDLSNPSHCGSCGLSCPPEASLCATAGPAMLERQCVSSCTVGQTACGGSCVDLSSNVDHCGGCGVVCDRSHAVGASCDGVACSYTCAPGYASCVKAGGDADGCETQIAGSDAVNCGGCGTTCTAAPAHAAPICDAGACDFACDNGYMRVGAGCVMACQGVFLTSAPFAGGSGTAPDPYVICSRAQLDEVRNYASLGARFKLLADVDLGGASFAPIGAAGTNIFSGIFDGGGRTLANLTYADTSRDDVGLFAIMDGSSSIANLTLQNVAISGRDRVGAAFGSGNGSIDHITVTGVVAGRDRVGGLVGAFDSGNINLSTSSAATSGRSFVGGLLGYGGSAAHVLTSTASGAVIGTGNDVGGIVGSIAGSTGNTVPLRGCFASGAVTGVDRVGGLVGSSVASPSSIQDSHASGAVTGGSGVGGLIGQNEVLLINAYASGQVTGTSSVGGLVGRNRGLVAHCYSTGAVTGSSATGGLVGSLDAGPYAYVAHAFWDTSTSGQLASAGGTGKTTLELMSAATFPTWDAYTRWTLGAGYPQFRATPTPCVVGASAFAGGTGSLADPFLVSQPAQLYHVRCNLNAAFKLTADLDFAGAPMTPQLSPASGSSFAGRFDGNGHSIANWVSYEWLGGLFSQLTASATIQNLALINVEVGGAYGVGALAGFSSATVTGVRASGVARGHYVVGGLIGNASIGTTLSRSTSSVVVHANDLAGGLVGYVNSVTVTDCAATGAVDAPNRAAGFASEGSGTITNSYAAGAVSSGSGFSNISNPVSSCYWDTEASGRPTSTRGTGLTTAQMQSQASYLGWDFATVWQLVSGMYPTLR